jgi:hypothetical protein
MGRIVRALFSDKEEQVVSSSPVAAEISRAPFDRRQPLAFTSL